MLRKAIKIVKSLIVLIVVFYVIFGIANWPTILKLIRNRETGTTTENQDRLDALRNIDIIEEDKNNNSPKYRSYTVAADSTSYFKNDWFYYPRLNIEGALEWNVAKDNINDEMINYLTHLSGTAEPADNGDMLISGHSSYYWWAKGTYKDIFAPLVNSAVGDEIVVKKNNVSYGYRVADIFEIGASDDLALSIGGANKRNLYLLTCVPVGTNLRRLIIRADLERIF